MTHERPPEWPSPFLPRIRGTKIQPPERKLSGRISHGLPGSETSGRLSKPWNNKHLRADIHDPNARTSMTPAECKKKNFGQKNFGLILRSLKKPESCSCNIQMILFDFFPTAAQCVLSCRPATHEQQRAMTNHFWPTSRFHPIPFPLWERWGSNMSHVSL